MSIGDRPGFVSQTVEAFLSQSGLRTRGFGVSIIEKHTFVFIPLPRVCTQPLHYSIVVKQHLSSQSRMGILTSRKLFLTMAPRQNSNPRWRARMPCLSDLGTYWLIPYRIFCCCYSVLRIGIVCIDDMCIDDRWWSWLFVESVEFPLVCIWA